MFRRGGNENGTFQNIVKLIKLGNGTFKNTWGEIKGKWNFLKHIKPIKQRNGTLKMELLKTISNQSNRGMELSKIG